jgi:hypothetical protein
LTGGVVELPGYVGWQIFPFEGEMRVKEPLPRMAADIAVMELYGFGMPLWYQLLPPIPEDVRDANLRTVADALSSRDARRAP